MGPPRDKQVALSTFSYVFSELVQYSSRVPFNFTPPYAVEAMPRDGTSLDVCAGIRQLKSGPPRNSKPIWKS